MQLTQRTCSKRERKSHRAITGMQTLDYMERLYCLLVSDFLLLCQLFVIPCAFIIILDAVDKLLCINTIISQENFIVTCALNIILDAVDIISRMHTVI